MLLKIVPFLVYNYRITRALLKVPQEIRLNDYIIFIM
jgi:hypothetical protein